MVYSESLFQFITTPTKPGIVIEKGGKLRIGDSILVIWDVRTLETTIPTEFGIWQNYPNPFNPSTIIKYTLPHASHVNLSVFNTLGQRVTLLVDGKQDAGYHEVTFEGSGLTSGVYFYRLQARSINSQQAIDYIETKKLILMK